MSLNGEQNTITTPQFDNLADECAFWKNSALKWKEKYENVKRLYAEALCKGNRETLLTLGQRKAKSARMTEKKKLLDPFSSLVFCAEIQTAIIQHLNKKDFLKMTEISRSWKNLLELNHIFDNIDLTIDLTPRQNLPGQELLKSMRQYKKFKISYSSNEQRTCFDILKKFSRSLEHVEINERTLAINDVSIDFRKLKTLIFSRYMSNEMCRFLEICEFPNLQVLQIRRCGASIELNIFLNETESLKELYIAADSLFYLGLLAFMEEEQTQSETSLEILHIEIIDVRSVLPIDAFIQNNESLTFLEFSGICMLANVARALCYFNLLKTLVLDFSISDNELEIHHDDLFDEEAEPHEGLRKLVIFDINIIKMENFKTLLLYTPNIEQLEIYSVITREIIEYVILSLPKLELFECSNIESDALEHFYQMRANNENNSRNYNTNFELKVIQ